MASSQQHVVVNQAALRKVLDQAVNALWAGDSANAASLQRGITTISGRAGSLPHGPSGSMAAERLLSLLSHRRVTCPGTS